MQLKALIIGNSDGIGLEVTKQLLKQNWKIIGLSRSPSVLQDPLYEHYVSEVDQDYYSETLKTIFKREGYIDLCIYCAGIGDSLDFSDMREEIKIFEVNLIGLVKTTSFILPKMLARKKGHLIGLSSMADKLLSPTTPSYTASKAGFSNYLESLALSLKSKGIFVTTIRFGFVDTKMAKGGWKPFLMPVDRAAWHILKCIKNKPRLYSAPWTTDLLLNIYSLFTNFRR